jgi:hypothetical protein
MSITILWRTVRGRWHDLVQQVWPDSPEERARAEIARLSGDLSRRYRRLVRLRQRIEQVRDLRDRQQRYLNEPSLEAPGRLQRSVERLRERLARLEGVYEDRRRQLERRKRLREALASGRMQVVEVVHGPGSSEVF